MPSRMELSCKSDKKVLTIHQGEGEGLNEEVSRECPSRSFTWTSSGLGRKVKLLEEANLDGRVRGAGH